MNFENLHPQARTLGPVWPGASFGCPPHFAAPAGVGIPPSVRMALSSMPLQQNQQMVPYPQQHFMWAQNAPPGLPWQMGAPVGENSTAKGKTGRMKKCVHGRRQACCKLCGGSQVCEHGKLKHQCRDCGGSGICPHDKRYATCKLCGGSQVCAHGRRKEWCKDCGGSGLCVHGKRRTRCKECSNSPTAAGSARAMRTDARLSSEHSQAVEMFPASPRDPANAPEPTRAEGKTVTSSSLALGGVAGTLKPVRPEDRTQQREDDDEERQVVKRQKVDGDSERSEPASGRRRAQERKNVDGCNGDAGEVGCGDGESGRKHCLHGRRQDRCQLCRGSQVCEHGKRRNQCKECGGSAFCVHGKRHAVCTLCGGSQVCAHGRRKDLCKECGVGMCEHGKRKNRCKVCKLQAAEVAADAEDHGEPASEVTCSASRERDPPQQQADYGLASEQPQRQSFASPEKQQGRARADEASVLSPVRRRMNVRALCITTP